MGVSVTTFRCRSAHPAVVVSCGNLTPAQTCCTSGHYKDVGVRISFFGAQNPPRLCPCLRFAVHLAVPKPKTRAEWIACPYPVRILQSLRHAGLARRTAMTIFRQQFLLRRCQLRCCGRCEPRRYFSKLCFNCQASIHREAKYRRAKREQRSRHQELHVAFPETYLREPIGYGGLSTSEHVQELMGHKTITMTLRCPHLAPPAPTGGSTEAVRDCVYTEERN